MWIFFFSTQGHRVLLPGSGEGREGRTTESVSRLLHRKRLPDFQVPTNRLTSQLHASLHKSLVHSDNQTSHSAQVSLYCKTGYLYLVVMSMFSIVKLYGWVLNILMHDLPLSSFYFLPKRWYYMWF